MQIAGQTAELPEIRRRARWLVVFFLLTFAALGVRLFYMQILEGDRYYKTTSDSIIRTEILPALRGEIRDRKGRVLARTRASYNVVVVPQHLDRQTYEDLVRFLGTDHTGELPDWDTLVSRTEKRKGHPYTLAEDVSRAAMATIETDQDKRGVSIVAVPRREYPYPSVAGHALGYLNEVSADDLQNLRNEGYSAGDKIGRTGIERQWEPYLRGRKGMRKYLASRRGVRQSEIQLSDLVKGPLLVDPVPGENLVLTLDVGIQKIVERALARHRTASAVVLDIDTGRVLAIASRPGFDSNQMSGRLSTEAATRMFTDPYRPFRDRTLNETYGPGSTFKVVSALVGLEDGLVTVDERTKCNRFIQIGRRRFRCTKAHGVVNLHDALVQSCNVYFYELAQRPGMMNRLARYATELGLGAPSGLGLNGEEAGFIPTEEWHRQRTESQTSAQGFMIGHALNTAIGEGASRVTVTQMALLYAAIAKDGVLWLPQIMERIESNNGTVLEEFPPRVRRHVSISADTMAILKRGLVGVVNNPKGTAYKMRPKVYSMAGKTGTAQGRRTNPRTGEVPLPHEQLDHAWFAGFAPVEKPRIAFAVLIEHGGHGGEVAAPAARDIVDGYMDLQAADEAAARQQVPTPTTHTARRP